MLYIIVTIVTQSMTLCNNVNDGPYFGCMYGFVIGIGYKGEYCSTVMKNKLFVGHMKLHWIGTLLLLCTNKHIFCLLDS